MRGETERQHPNKNQKAKRYNLYGGRDAVLYMFRLYERGERSDDNQYLLKTPSTLQVSHLILTTTHSSILAWRIPRTEDPGELQSMGS